MAHPKLQMLTMSAKGRKNHYIILCTYIRIYMTLCVQVYTFWSKGSGLLSASGCGIPSSPQYCSHKTSAKILQISYTHIRDNASSCPLCECINSERQPVHCGVVCILAAEIQFVYAYMYVAVRRVFHAHFDPQFLVKPVFIITIPAKPASCETHSKGHKGTMLSIPSESNTCSAQ
jgi:hypothetical protein